jgi:hypothetical protein
MYCAIKMSELKQLKNNHEFCLLLCTAQFNLTHQSFTLAWQAKALGVRDNGIPISQFITGFH